MPFGVGSKHINTEHNNGNVIGLAIGVLLTVIFSSILIWVVGPLGLGLEVDGFGPALIAGIAIALVGGVVTWALITLGIKISNELRRAAVNVLLGAVVLLICDRFLAGLTVNGFAGALVASLAIGVIAWLLSLIPQRINRAAAQQEQDARRGS
jgi:uncharacterized membrane protein YvlD (DUF360 family)